MCCPPLQGYDKGIYRRLNLICNFLNLCPLFGRSRFYKGFCKQKGLQASDEDYDVELYARALFASTLIAGL